MVHEPAREPVMFQNGLQKKKEVLIAEKKYQKNPRAHKNKSALRPPKKAKNTPPLNRVVVVRSNPSHRVCFSTTSVALSTLQKRFA